VPIHVGGHSAAAVVAPAGWATVHPLGLAATCSTSVSVRCAKPRLAAGRDPDAIEITLGGLLDQPMTNGWRPLKRRAPARLVLSIAVKTSTRRARS